MWSSTGMSSGWVTPICSSQGLATEQGELLLPDGSSATMDTTMSAPGRSTSFSPMVAQPAWSMSVLRCAAASARASTAALLRAAGPA